MHYNSNLAARISLSFRIRPPGWRKYISTDRVLHPTVPKTAINEIINPGYIERLKPERRLDATLYYDAVFSAGNE